MTVTLNPTGASHARSLINAGNYDDESAWSFSVEDGDKLLGPNGDNWGAYSDMHLGEDTSAAQKTKARWKYPFGKEGKVYGAALRAIRSRASQQGATAIFDEAGRLLDLIETKEGENPADPEEKPASRSTVVPFTRRHAPAQASGYRVVRSKEGDSAEIYLYGLIGGGGFFSDGTEITAVQFQKDLKALGPVKMIDVRINSEGGDVFDGKTIYTLLQQHPAKVTMHVDGLAASAASFIAMAGDVIEISESAFMMIHNAWSVAFGNAADMRKSADLLDAVDGTLVDVYAARTKTPSADVKQMMADETWMSGKDAVANGFADRMVPNMAVAASVRDPSKFRHLPAALRPNRVAAMARIAEMHELIR